MRRDALLRAGYAAIAAAILLLDQATKLLVTARLALYASVPVVPGLFHITVVTNRGALFGMFHDLADPVRSVVFTAVPAAAIGLMLMFMWKTPLQETITQTGLALILGGALGNLADRLRLGHVIDFLDVFVGDHHWPAFNVADASICSGVALLVADMLARAWRRRGAAVPEA